MAIPFEGRAAALEGRIASLRSQSHAKDVGIVETICPSTFEGATDESLDGEGLAAREMGKEGYVTSVVSAAVVSSVAEVVDEGHDEGTTTEVAERASSSAEKTTCLSVALVVMAPMAV